MPRVEVLNQLSMAPTRVGTTYAYHPLFVPIIELDRLPRKPTGTNPVCVVSS
jgi:hypothetical protein